MARSDPIFTQLYKRYSQDLLRFCPEHKDKYLCPLCLVAFDIKGLQNNTLTVEHPIPSKLGGRYTILTCKPCNNILGSKLDSHLVAMVNAIEGHSGISPLQATADIDGNRVRLELLLSKTPAIPNEMKVVGNATNPLALKGFMSALQKESDPISVNVDFRYIPQRAD